MVYESEVLRQLAQIPESSHLKLQAGADQTPLTDAEVEAIAIARAWSRVILKPGIAPADDALFVPFEAEEGGVDAIRTQYAVGDRTIQVAQSFCVFCAYAAPVEIRYPPVTGTELLRDLEETARSLLNTNSGIRFELLEASDESYLGRQTPERNALGHQNWLDGLHWWTSGRDLGFATLKTGDEPGMAVMGWGLELNRRWFGPKTA